MASTAVVGRQGVVAPDPDHIHVFPRRRQLGEKTTALPGDCFPSALALWTGLDSGSWRFLMPQWARNLVWVVGSSRW